MMPSFIQVITTVAEKEQARDLARTVLEQRLAGCVQITPCTSLYHWKGTIEEDGEFVCVMKTRADLFPLLKEKILEIHPYTIPEILATPILDGHGNYLEWLNNELKNET